MKKGILYLSFIINTLISSAQWVEVEVPLTSQFNAINGGVYLTKDSIVVYDIGSAYLSIDRGYSFIIWPNNEFRRALNICRVADNKFRLIHLGSRKIISSDDKGITWYNIEVTNQIDTPFKNGRIILSHFFDEQRGFVMGNIINGCYNTWKTTNGGAKWEKVSCNNITVPTYQNSPVLSFDKVYEANGEAWFKSTSRQEANKLIRVRNYGATFDSITIHPGKVLIEMGFKDTINGLALLADTNDFSQRSLYITSNAGQTWIPLNNNSQVTIPSGIKCFKRKNSKAVYIVYGEDGLNYSINDGLTWNYFDYYLHDDMVIYDEKNMLSFFRENGNNKNLRVFNSEMAGLKSMDEVSYIPLVYPNPVKDYLYFNIAAVSFMLNDCNGKSILSGKTINNEMINLQNLTQGFYFITLTLKNGNRVSHKLVIE
ncbi:MAG: T9SS type A sorting domain-containing protein [Bacteroidota bacterium]|nr:T9SS type A sorting domain-containing protein [Bacteroidota bacterium]